MPIARKLFARVIILCSINEQVKILKSLKKLICKVYIEKISKMQQKFRKKKIKLNYFHQWPSEELKKAESSKTSHAMGTKPKKK